MLGNLLTTQEFAKRLGVSPGRVRQFLVQGRLPHAVKVAGAWLIPESDIDFVKDRQVGRPKGRQRNGGGKE